MHDYSDKFAKCDIVSGMVHGLVDCNDINDLRWL